MSYNLKNLIIAIIVIAIALIAYSYMTTPENRSAGQKIDAAVNQLDNGVDNAARELQDRTPAERAKDAIKDATDK
jgi:short subunit fatty acids transporter